MIEPIDMPEAALILGDHFPTRDEDAYRREALKAQAAAQSSAGGRAVMAAQAGYTDAEFLGRAGTALEGVFGQQCDGFDHDHTRHRNIAAWLLWAADNIETTKRALNDTVRDYHESYERAFSESRENAWPQIRLATIKSDLVQQAQQRVATLSAGYLQRHELAQQGVASGGDAPASRPLT